MPPKMSRDLSAIESLLAEPLVRLKPSAAPTVDMSSLADVLKAMLAKIQQQDDVISAQQEQIEKLQRDVAALRTQQQEEAQTTKRELRRTASDIDQIKAKQRLQNQRMDRIRGDVEELTHNNNNNNNIASSPEQRSSSSSSADGSPTAEASAQPSLLSPPVLVHAVTTPRQVSPVDHPPQQSWADPPQQSRSQPVSAPISPNRQRPMIGIDVTDTTDGLVVSGVKPGGPAALAGLEVNDVLFTVNGEVMSSRAAFASFLERCSIGQSLDFVFSRRGKRMVSRLYVVSGSAPRATR